MATLRHEHWEDADGSPSLCLAGPMGDVARALLEPGARLVWTFDAGSAFEAMTLYNQRLGRGPWTTEFAQDHLPYPDEWRRIQDGSSTE